MKSTGRTFVIGDIHGALKALIQVIERAEVKEDDLLIFLGDYVDGWSQSPEVINYLIQLKDTHNCIFMRGNHDELCYRWLKFDESNDTWLLHGGKATVDAYEKIPYNFRSIHVHFLENLNNYYIDDESTIGGNLLVKNSSFTNCGAKEKNGILLNTRGIVNVDISDNEFKNNPVTLVALLWGAKNNSHSNNRIKNSGKILVEENLKMKLMY